MRDDALHHRYLEQLQWLGEFRQAHGERHPEAAIDGDDPAVRRLLEGLALFSARTQLATQRNLQASLSRLLAGYFEFMLTPMPAMATVQALGCERLTEPALLPAGAEVTLDASDGAQGSFRTLAPLTLLPVSLDGSEVQLLEGGFRLLVHLRARYPIHALSGPIRLRVHCLDSYVAGLRIVHHLGRHLRAGSVFFDRRPSDARPGVACAVSFGDGAGDDGGDALAARNPLERLRTLLHYPELELFVNVSVPSPPRAWTRLTLALDLGPGWPDRRAVGPELFQLHAVPVVNLRRAPAAAISCDGTRTAFPIVAAEPERQLELHALRGVYKLTASGLVPLAPSTLPGGDESYAVEPVETAHGMKPRLVLRCPSAIERRQRFALEADWHQPRFSEHAFGPLAARLHDGSLGSVGWRVLGPLQPWRPSPLGGSSEAMLGLLALRTRPTLEGAELLRLLALLGLTPETPLGALLPRVRGLRHAVSFDGGGGGARHRYVLELGKVAPADEALAWTLVARVRALLEAWSEASVVEVEVEADLGAVAGVARALPPRSGGAR